MLLTFGSICQLQAQDRVPFDQGKKYILADVKLTNKISFNEQTVVTFSGLQKGQEITIPGEELSTAIKKLGKLNLFSDIDFYVNKIQNDSVYLDLAIIELPKLSKLKFIGIKKSKTEVLIKENKLDEDAVVNENLITTTKNYIERKYKKEGYFNTKVSINTVADTSTVNHVNMIINIDKGQKVKIAKIDFVGNTLIKNKVLRKALKDTKQRNPLRVLKASKYIKDKYTKDLENLIDTYKERGYRDARIISDTVAYDKDANALKIKINVEEGRKYYFGDIKFLGNTIYPDEGLAQLLGVKKGDTYNGVLLQKRIADKTKPDGEDITNLYQNNGYLFSSINAVEVKTVNDTIDFEIRILEGPIAYFNKISVVGNDKTNDHVIYRELRTKPGEKYSKELLVRTIREIGQLGFFDPETIEPKFKNVDATAGTVDIEYPLTEKGASQIELQGGYGGSGFIGTLGLSFSNFSMRNIFNKNAYKPFPTGDGQKVSLRLQASNYFNTSSISFSEPWFGGKKPVQFSTSLSFSTQYLSNFTTYRADKSKSFNIITFSVGIAKRLTVPDDFFVLSHSLSYQHYDLNNYFTGLFKFGNGASRNLAYTIGLTRNNKGVNPIFPTYGSEFSFSAKFSPPYSLFNKVDYKNLENQAEYKTKNELGRSILGIDGQEIKPGDYTDKTVEAIKDGFDNEYTTAKKVATLDDAGTNEAKLDQKRFNWLEYYKIKFKADWYNKIYKKLVLRSTADFGFLGAYNNDRGMIPFERYFMGGDGMTNFAMDGRENVQLRGYPNNSLTPTINGFQEGATVYNKFSTELRYPITLKASASIFALAFLEAGNSYNSFKTFQPFNLNRSAGFGVRVFMPAFGMLGIDFAHGFDALPGETGAHGWETHFIIGQQF